MLSQKFGSKTATDNSITSLNEIANRAQSKECVIQFTKLFIDNIIYERKIIDKSNFVDTNFKGVQLKKLKESSQDRLIKNLDVYFEGIKDAIEKEYLSELIFRICHRNNADDSLEQYHLNYKYYSDNNSKSCDNQKTMLSVKSLIEHSKASLNRFFEPLPEVTELDTYINLRFNDKTPAEYIAPHFIETERKLRPTNPEHTICNLGAVKTPFLKMKCQIQGFCVYNSVDDEMSLHLDEEEEHFSVADSLEQGGELICISDEFI